MIDTIIFRIEDLEHHKELVDFLHQKSAAGTSRFVKVFEKGVDAEMMEKRSYHHNYFRDHTDGHEFEQAYRNFIRSYHYDVNYGIFFDRDYIEFNFSIPKYLYGTNVFQFVPQYFDPDYLDFRGRVFSDTSDAVFKRLFRFLGWFFEKEFGGLVDFRFVRLARVDMCYNKVFNSKEDAFTYLSDIKRIKKKFIRDTAAKNNTYSSGIYYPATDYTFKVYHKGSEFRVHDLPKLRQKKVFVKSELQSITDFADRIVRYELEFKGAYLSKLFAKYIFRKDSDYWPHAWRYYTSISKSGYVRVKGKKTFLNELTPIQRQIYKYGKHYLGKRFWFYLESENRYDDTGDESYEIESGKWNFPKHQKFGLYLFRRMMKTFHMFYREFSIIGTNDLKGFLDKVKIVADDLEATNLYLRDSIATANGGWEPWMKDVTINKVQSIFRMLQSHTWADLSSQKLVPERTLYRYKKVFRILGVEGDVQSVQTVLRGNDTFQDYYLEMERNFNLQAFSDSLKTKF
jgi:hypothetical protein